MKRGIKVLAAAGMLVAATVGTSAASTITWSGNNHVYELVQMPGVSWADAQLHLATNRGQGWYLATITSAAEQSFVATNLLASSGGSEYWLGGYQNPVEQNPSAGWAWVTGEPWDYTAWSWNEPNDVGGVWNETLLGIWQSGGWNDEDNLTVISGYIAEATVPEPGTFALLAVGLAALGLVKRRQRKL